MAKGLRCDRYLLSCGERYLDAPKCGCDRVDDELSTAYEQEQPECFVPVPNTACIAETLSQIDQFVVSFRSIEAVPTQSRPQPD